MNCLFKGIYNKSFSCDVTSFLVAKFGYKPRQHYICKHKSHEEYSGGSKVKCMSWCQYLSSSVWKRQETTSKAASFSLNFGDWNVSSFIERKNFQADYFPPVESIDLLWLSGFRDELLHAATVWGFSKPGSLQSSTFGICNQREWPHNR